MRVLRGQPGLRRVKASPSRAAVACTQGCVPSGRPRPRIAVRCAGRPATDCRLLGSSSSGDGRLARGSSEGQLRRGHASRTRTSAIARLAPLASHALGWLRRIDRAKVSTRPQPRGSSCIAPGTGALRHGGGRVPGAAGRGSPQSIPSAVPAPRRSAGTPPSASDWA